ncbi:MAG: hypothetical protein ACJ76J_13075 [Thermoanaerobaculia bacterium]
MSQAEQVSIQAVQEALAMLPDKAELKPERVQQQLARLLGWEERPDWPGLHRIRRFASGMESEAYAGLVLKLATRRRQQVRVDLSGKQVHVTIQGRPGRKAGFTDAVYDLACALG